MSARAALAILALGRNRPAACKENEVMPRYIVEREFPKGLEIPIDPEGRATCERVAGVNAREGVSWVHSYVSTDKKKTFCVYDAPSPEAIRRVASQNTLPVGAITEVRVLDPYFYQ